MTPKAFKNAVTALADGERYLVFVLANGESFVGYCEPENSADTVLVMNDAPDASTIENVFIEVAAIVAIYTTPGRAE